MSPTYAHAAFPLVPRGTALLMMLYIECVLVTWTAGEMTGWPLVLKLSWILLFLLLALAIGLATIRAQNISRGERAVAAVLALMFGACVGVIAYRKGPGLPADLEHLGLSAALLGAITTIPLIPFFARQFPARRAPAPRRVVVRGLIAVLAGATLVVIIVKLAWNWSGPITARVTLLAGTYAAALLANYWLTRALWKHGLGEGPGNS